MAFAQSETMGLPKILLHSLCSMTCLGGTRLVSAFGDTSDSQELSIGEAEVVAWKEKTRNRATLPNEEDK